MVRGAGSVSAGVPSIALATEGVPPASRRRSQESAPLQAATDDPCLTFVTRHLTPVIVTFMALIDFILNLAGLLLWLNWRSARFDPLGKRTPATLIGTLRRAEPRRLRRWHLLAALGGLLLLRAGIYWQIGSAAHWTGTLNLSVITLSFRSDYFVRMLLFSIFSFGLTLGVFYLWLLLLSILAGPEPLPFHRLVRMPLGGIDRWARGVKFLLPLMVDR